jgi:hypothetical protein
MFTQLFHSIIIAMSLSTTTGILLHDTRIDKMTATALSTPSLVTYADIDKVAFKADLHPHVERTSFSQVVHDIHNQNPRIQPRENHDRKHMMQKYAPKGHHAFDNYSLPLA